MNRTRKDWVWIDWFVVCLRFVSFIIAMTNSFEEPYLKHVDLIFSWSLLAFALPQLFYIPNNIRPAGYIISEMLMSGGLTLYLLLIHPESIAYLSIPILVVSYVAMRHRKYLITGIFFIAILLFLIFFMQYPFERFFGSVLNLLLFSVFGSVFGVFLNQKMQLSRFIAIVEQRNKELENYVQQIEKLTILEERNRISKDLHDIVGHSMTASIMGMEAIYSLIERKPEMAKERLESLIKYNKEGLLDFRKIVHAMAISELNQPLEKLLESTIHQFQEQTGVDVHLGVKTGDFSISNQKKIVYLRFLQEGLTNAIRHGRASSIHVELLRTDLSLILKIRDNGVGLEIKEMGFGLTSMKERIEALRGRLTISAHTTKGTTIECSVHLEDLQ
ncbi:sensor histidine kinase [Fictibacillus fluitans]|uniref:histidine kinase n=1 Tax=Fictibacillus fluitans TaxID=3058422 RepID=A0ABT8HTF4_9BACL|nr:sensor histidine kinase [Fictibacillus sp. NE201]MDN4524026.1 sensor histidine kinase [Fictibacillus sp. NE201]